MDQQQPPQESLDALKRAGIVNAKFERTEKGQVTAQWGVDWSPEFIARDLLQNFYDANKNRVSDIAITRQKRTVCIAGPESFDLKHLFYIGSHKGKDDVGQFGEGFKVATVCLLRRGIAPIAQSGQEVLRIRLGGVIS